jgi:hypothetical protein
MVIGNYEICIINLMLSSNNQDEAMLSERNEQDLFRSESSENESD